MDYQEYLALEEAMARKCGLDITQVTNVRSPTELHGTTKPEYNDCEAEPEAEPVDPSTIRPEDGKKKWSRHTSEDSKRLAQIRQRREYRKRVMACPFKRLRTQRQAREYHQAKWLSLSEEEQNRIRSIRNAKANERYANDPEFRRVHLERSRRYHQTPEYREKERLRSRQRRAKKLLEQKDRIIVARIQSLTEFTFDSLRIRDYELAKKLDHDIGDIARLVDFVEWKHLMRFLQRQSEVRGQSFFERRKALVSLTFKRLRIQDWKLAKCFDPQARRMTFEAWRDMMFNLQKYHKTKGDNK